MIGYTVSSSSRNYELWNHSETLFYRKTIMKWYIKSHPSLSLSLVCSACPSCGVFVVACVPLECRHATPSEGVRRWPRCQCWVGAAVSGPGAGGAWSCCCWVPPPDASAGPPAAPPPPTSGPVPPPCMRPIDLDLRGVRCCWSPAGWESVTAPVSLTPIPAGPAEAPPATPFMFTWFLVEFSGGCERNEYY